ncbi:hypothetical protein GCM10007973_29890 [Polymorphobacter multimanifer]|uniref:AraC-like DNA-binding protein n=1 Tax=Polymorphobacter multimanifer TaxID=1070431 RepID=A0A841LI07_9SPHN|nr:AraC family transcriptional regulator [Polymorphobacter multimanifer]MBB6229445.1 AraC-like DNA-binding protein [Polymorphobacter multimanifer]GGI91626.1 hypothetical protein GCM10007973_29890 [Polymorphobacter multimanifer]
MSLSDTDALDQLLSLATPAEEADRIELEPDVSFWRSTGRAPPAGLAYEATIPEGLHFSAGNAEVTTVIAGRTFAFRGFIAAHFRADVPLMCASRTEPGTRWTSLGLWVDARSELFEVLGDGLGALPEPRPANLQLCALITNRTAASFKGVARSYALRADGYAMLAHIHEDGRLATGTPDKRRKEAIKLARLILDQEYPDPPSLAELARRVGLNRRYLTGDFSAVNGMSIARYITRLRLGHADAMLATGIPVAEAALRVGLTPSHFAQAYRRRFGHPPSERLPFEVPRSIA